MSVVNPTCPEDCTANLPNVEFSDCAPEINNSQIRNVYITKRRIPAYKLAECSGVDYSSGTVRRYSEFDQKTYSGRR